MKKDYLYLGIGIVAGIVAWKIYQNRMAIKNETTANAIGIGRFGKIRKARETCQCEDGTTYQCLRPGCCENYCSRFGGMERTLKR